MIVLIGSKSSSPLIRLLAWSAVDCAFVCLRSLGQALGQGLVFLESVRRVAPVPAAAASSFSFISASAGSSVALRACAVLRSCSSKRIFVGHDWPSHFDCHPLRVATREGCSSRHILSTLGKRLSCDSLLRYPPLASRSCVPPVVSDIVNESGSRLTTTPLNFLTLRPAQRCTPVVRSSSPRIRSRTISSACRYKNEGDCNQSQSHLASNSHYSTPFRFRSMYESAFYSLSNAATSRTSCPA